MITANAGNVLTDALVALGQLIQGASYNASEGTSGLRVINALIDRYGIERALAPMAVPNTFGLTAATQSYTIGSGATINIARPAAIESAAIVLASGPGSPIHVCTAEEWEQIDDRQASSWKVKFLFYDRNIVSLSGSTPTGKIYLSPVPLGGTLEYVAWYPAIAQFTDLTTTQVFLDGFYDLLYLETAMQLSPNYRLSPEQVETLQERYQAARAAVVGLNASLMGPEPPPGTQSPVSPAPAVTMHGAPGDAG